MMRPLVILTGPTAVGKTALSIKLAKEINGQIISADSVQVFKGMDIGSAKISEEEKEGIKHYLIDVLDPDETFDVSVFKDMATKAVNEIYDSGHIPILVGGTGFYIHALLYDADFDDASHDESIRKELTEYYEQKGTDALFDLLRECDPKSCLSIHKNNTARVIRAIEYFKTTGKPISEHNEEEHRKDSPYNFAYFVLNDDRSLLYERIDRRIDKMLEDGLIEEVKELLAKGYSLENGSMKALGYKEIISFLNGEADLETAVYILKRDTRHFAKRQLTWFKREDQVIWLDRSLYSEDQIFDIMLKELESKEIIKNDQRYL